MRDLVFEQTHAIHFEMIEDLFEGCQQFEKDFLGSPSLACLCVSGPLCLRLSRCLLSLLLLLAVSGSLSLSRSFGGYCL